MIKSVTNHMEMFSGSFSKNLNKTVKTKINFNDIAGLKEVKEDVREFVDILKGEDKFKK